MEKYLFCKEIKKQEYYINLYNYCSKSLKIIPNIIDTRIKVIVRIVKGLSFWNAFIINIVSNSIPVSSLKKYFVQIFSEF